MKAVGLVFLVIACTMVGLLGNASVRTEEPPVAASPNLSVEAEHRPHGESGTTSLSIEVARDRAKVMHELYSATLDVLHDRYFHGDRAIVPARAMQDIFATIKQQSNVEARWISVNMQPMSVDHEPKSDFEKNAAKEIAAGKAEFEAVDGDYFRRAGVIHLGNGCVSCHSGFFKEPSKTPKFAGLIISVPIRSSYLTETK